MSVSKVAKRRGTILDEILSYHRQQLPKLMREVPLSDVRALASVAPPTVDLFTALKEPGVSLIAECKRASPSKGLLVKDYDPVALTNSYVQGGASAISVLTDGRHFQGSLADLRDVKETVIYPDSIITEVADRRRSNGIPVLRKDFIFDPYQVYESRAAGADAILLIAAVLDGGELRELMQLSYQMGMNALVEVHDQVELERAMDIQPSIIGINNRNLQTFEVDFENSSRLATQIPDEIVTVSESGIKTIEDVDRLREMGVDAMLVGESLIRSRNVSSAARSLVLAGK